MYFTPEEVAGLDTRLVEMLNAARTIAGIPFVITSGLRTSEENKDAQGVENSAHLRGLGVDLRCGTAKERFLMLDALLRVGFPRVGIYDAHVHADVDVSLPSLVMWTGFSK